MIGKNQMIIDKNIYLVSYPRSGNTWLRYLLANILEPDIDWSLNNINAIVPDMYEVDNNLTSAANFIKSHEPCSNQYQYVVYLYRDGRDVAVSYYDLCVKAFDYKHNFDYFLESMLSGTDVCIYGSWQNHVADWIKNDNVLLSLSYEQLVFNTKFVISQLCHATQVNCTDQIIDKAIEKSSFSIQKDHVKQYSPFYSKGFMGGVKGGPGKWKEVFTSEQNEFFWRKAGDVMSSLGYKKYE